MPAHSQSGRPWRRLKARVIRRDAGICHLCGQPGADSADHLIPFSHGGPNTMDNLAAVHHDVEPRCNRARGNQPLSSYIPKTNDPPSWDW